MRIRVSPRRSSLGAAAERVAAPGGRGDGDRGRVVGKGRWSGASAECCGDQPSRLPRLPESGHAKLGVSTQLSGDQGQGLWSHRIPVWPRPPARAVFHGRRGRWHEQAASSSQRRRCTQESTGGTGFCDTGCRELAPEPAPKSAKLCWQGCVRRYRRFRGPGPVKTCSRSVRAQVIQTGQPPPITGHRAEVLDLFSTPRSG